MSNQLRLLFFIVVISGALCTIEDYVIMSQCAHNKAIHLAAEGTVSVTDISQTQNITIVGLPDFVNNDYKIALYAKETKRYLCFNENWKLVGMKELQDTCYFNETIVHGYFVFRSVVDLQRRIGFTHRGKPIGPKKNISNDACYMFTKIQADQFFQQHLGKIMASPSTATLTASTTAATKSTLAATTTTTTTTTKTSTAHNKTKESRNKKNNRNKHNNNNHKQHKIQNQLHSNGHNSNISHNHNNNNKREQHTNRNNSNNNTREHVQRHHLVRHHHNDPNSIARRQHHEHKQKRRQQQQHQEQQQQHNRLRATLASLITTTKTLSNSSSTPFTTFTTNTFRKTKQTALSNAKSFTTTTTRTAIINSSIFKKSNQEENVATKATTIRTRTPTVKANKHKGRKRKIERVNKKHAHHKQRLLHKLQQQQQPNVTISTTTTTNFDDDWASSGNWWGNFTDDYNNNSSNNNYNNSDETNNEWLTLEPSISTSLDALSTLDVNDVTEIDESSNYYSSTTSKYRDINNKQQKSTTTLTTTTTLDDSNFSSQSGIDTTSIYAPTYDTSQATETSNATIGDDTWSPTATMYDLDFETNFNNESSENETSANIWATAQSKATVIDTTTSIINHDNSSDIFEYNADNADNSSDHLWTSMHDDTDDHRQLGVTTPLDLPNTPTTSTITKTTTTTIAQNNTKNYKQLQIRPYNKKFYRPGNKNNSKFVRKLANAAVTSANHQHLTTAATTKTRMRKISVPLSKWSITTTTQKSFNHNNNNNHNNKSNIIQINKSISQTSINNNSLIDNFNDHLHASSARASASTVATAKDRPLRISTQRLLATPFHQLIQYVRNDAGEIELDNIDNISVYPDVSEDYSLDSEYDAVQSESNLNKRINLMPNRRLTIKGYLPTSASAVLPESIKIAKIKINKERKRILRQRQRRRHGDGSQA